jgi:site-specific DNA-methyltransferase (adenine-specific)
MIQPYYKDEWVKIYHGDCREILPQLGPVETVITDPVWPDCVPDLVGKDNPQQLFNEMLISLPPVERLVIQLGCDTDPRFLSNIPRDYPFLRVCNLDYAVPHYKGRVLYTGDIAYAFGTPPCLFQGGN